ncbi:hypothetical protein CLAFUW4_12561 [Fulvia fulva]|uniref:Uncharacterized protein n=1 Tax=Passalora fulva TaxID=5499 RepID=A0A9Q8PEH5_PASFU|nr:uncharacterized protein CLAFUR5_11586 [Fulvia fulva]KAK4617453.1 hypothetical protein CLAFUR4_12566 [Fulvia fulva]KAK4618404.1 hypothetical protein CLAFUR0_12577 [Fulvia fulva]UJO21104.1 hypothetical protein CLAFUR5_11586 [Fulvia fulva]WPV18106.1 hypothetical protein CLAFUW4_12561 [Fulvia fulva]WPV33560.1 hypothetical protein CLAFUW7_12568 [Fulvia fulva]
MFYATIEYSPQIKEMLWYTPPTPPLDDDDGCESMELNPLLKDRDPVGRYPWCSTCSLPWAKFIEVKISTSALARLRQGASFSNMCLWKSCAPEVSLWVEIRDEDARYYKLRRRIPYGELALDGPPTVMELVDVVFKHEQTTRWTRVHWISGSEGMTPGDDDLSMIIWKAPEA